VLPTLSTRGARNHCADPPSDWGASAREPVAQALLIGIPYHC